MKTAVIVVIILLIGTLYSLTIRHGHDWGDDFAMYIHHAKNIAEGISYNQIGYIRNPYYPSYSPTACPPLFPLLLSPVYWWFGLNLSAMKIEIIVFFCVCLFIFYWIFRSDLPFTHVAAIVTIIGVTPYLWEFKDQILSDVPFLCLLYPGLFFINRAYQSGQSETKRRLYVCIIGVSIYLAYATRTVGIILIPCLLGYDLLKKRRTSSTAVLATTVSLALILFQELLVRGGHSSFSSLLSSPGAFLANASFYAKSLSLVWSGGYGDSLSQVFFILLCVLAILGYSARIREGVTSFEVFVPLYIGVVLLWPYIQGRYVIPLIPLLVLYAFVGIRKTPVLRRKPVERSATVVLVLLILLTYSGWYARANYGAIQEGVGKETAAEMFDFIIRNTDAGDVFISRKPRALSLFTGRAASVYRPGQDPQELWNFIRVVGARYFVVGPIDPPDIVRFLEQYRTKLELVYRNPDFTMYRITASD